MTNAKAIKLFGVTAPVKFGREPANRRDVLECAGSTALWFLPLRRQVQKAPSSRRTPKVAGLFGLIVLLSAASPAAASSRAPLADAVEKMDRPTVRALLERRVDVNAPQTDGMTALHWAAYQDDLETAKLLVKAGANVKAANRYEVTPLSLACQDGNTALLELLLEAGADPNTTLHGGETALMTAARTGKIGPVKALLSRGADVNAKEKRGQTALMWAAADGHAAVVELLIAAGAEYRTALDSGFTPFFFAVREGRTDVVRVFLKAGVDVNDTMQPRKTNGKSPRKGTSALNLAVENGHLDLALILLEAGADPNDQRSGFTALHTLTWVRKPNRGDGDDGDPPPIGSGNLSSLQFVKKLVEHGADVNARLKNGRSGPGLYSKAGATPFLMAAATADTAYMRLLVELGADPLLGNVDNCTPLMAATGIGIGGGEADEVAGTEPEVLEAVQLALELGADVNAVDANGETAMHGAAYKNHPKVVQFLADKGARIEIWNKKNKYGWTPLLIAEGYRPGNFKPSAETIAALHRVMLAAGVTPPINNTPVAAAGTEEYKRDTTKKPAP
jgi:ankyrin repeat protein